MQILSLDDLLNPLFKSSSIEIVTRALLLRNDEGGLSSSMPFRILHRCSPPSQGRPRFSCSFFTADSLVLTVLPAIRPAYDNAHARRMSSPSGRELCAEIPRPSLKERNSRNWLASFFCEAIIIAAYCMLLILSNSVRGNSGIL